MALEELARVGRQVGDDQVGLVELGEQGDDLALAGRAVGIALETARPDFLHRLRAVEARDNVVGFGPEPEELVGEPVLGDMPALAAEVLFADRDGRAQAQALAGHAVPRFAEEGALLVGHDGLTTRV